MGTQTLTKQKVAAVQAAPEFLDLDTGVDKAIRLMPEASAAERGSSLFPRSGHCHGCWSSVSKTTRNRALDPLGRELQGLPRLGSFLNPRSLLKPWGGSPSK